MEHEQSAKLSVSYPTLLKESENLRFILRPFVMFALAAAFYLYVFIIQVSLSIMTEEVMHDFGIAAAGLGFIAAAYFYAYTAMQIPAGLLFDRFSSRALITLALLACVVGTFIFAITNNYFIATAARFLMGAGSAFSMLGILVLTVRWFPPRYYAFLVGISQMLCSLGAILGEMPLASLVTHYTWRYTLLGIAIIGAALAFVIWFFIRDYPSDAKPIESHQTHHESEFKKLFQISSKKQTWYIGLYAFAIWTPILIFASLWGVAFLVNYYNTTVTIASAALSIIWIGIAIGSPIFGWWSDAIDSRCIPLQVSGLIGIVSTLLILFIPHIPWPLMYLLLFLFGIGASGQALSFAVVKDCNKAHEVGTASGFNNMATVMGAALLQPVVGMLLQHYWKGVTHLGTPVYSISAYQKTLIILPLCFLLAFILGRYFITETHCKHIESD